MPAERPDEARLPAVARVRREAGRRQRQQRELGFDARARPGSRRGAARASSLGPKLSQRAVASRRPSSKTRPLAVSWLPSVAPSSSRSPSAHAQRRLAAAARRQARRDQHAASPRPSASVARAAESSRAPSPRAPRPAWAAARRAADAALRSPSSWPASSSDARSATSSRVVGSVSERPKTSRRNGLAGHAIQHGDFDVACRGRADADGREGTGASRFGRQLGRPWLARLRLHRKARAPPARPRRAWPARTARSSTTSKMVPGGWSVRPRRAGDEQRAAAQASQQPAAAAHFSRARCEPRPACGPVGYRFR